MEMKKYFYVFLNLHDWNYVVVPSEEELQFNGESEIYAYHNHMIGYNAYSVMTFFNLVNEKWFIATDEQKSLIIEQLCKKIENDEPPVPEDQNLPNE